MRRSCPLLFVIAWSLLVAGCNEDKQAGPGQGSGTAAPASTGKVVLFIDDKAVATIDAGKTAGYPPLGALLPADSADPTTWKSIIVTTAGKPSVFPSPTASNPGLVAALFTTRGGIAFGFFAPEDLAKKGKPQREVQGVTEIRIALGKGMAEPRGEGDGEGGGGENDGARPELSAELVIRIKGPAGEVAFTGAQLAKLTTTTAPIGDMDTPGWTLPAVLEAAGVKLGDAKQIVMYGQEGANLVLAPRDFDPAHATLFIKLNRQGKLRFRVFRKVGQTWEVAGELRGISEVELK